ncbi:MAG: DUF885 domain-containing protein, partial [Myxococcales bacterium]|nr:DUF885 domain-containing protein [Myxococcales bacterium]
QPVRRWGRVAAHQPLADEQGVEALGARFLAIADAVDAWSERLTRVAGTGRTAPAPVIARARAMMEQQVKSPPEKSLFLQSVHFAPDSLDEQAQVRARQRLEAQAREHLWPALRRFTNNLSQLEAHARTGSDVGLHALPGGPGCYAERIKHHTTLSLPAEHIHAAGLAALEAIETEVARIGQSLFDTSSAKATFAKVRASTGEGFPTPEAVMEETDKRLKTARTKIATAFAPMPAAELRLEAIPEQAAPFAPLALFQPPSPDGVQPATLRLNVHALTSRPRYLLPVLIAHEGVPGHHLQETMARSLTSVPAFRQHHYEAAYIEGWGLYAEALADELGMYESARERLGFLVYDAWRSARLVVDTGLHELGWDRGKALEFMLAHTALSREEASKEVDRYLAMPGQALSYKLGSMEIERLRKLASDRLGERFDLKDFHAVVLGNGPLPLEPLGEIVAAWVKAGGGTP